MSWPTTQTEPTLDDPFARPPTAKTVREVRLEELLREMLPFVSTTTQPTEKTIALIERVTKEIK